MKWRPASITTGQRTGSWLIQPGKPKMNLSMNCSRNLPLQTPDHARGASLRVHLFIERPQDILCCSSPMAELSPFQVYAHPKPIKSSHRAPQLTQGHL